MRGFLLSDETPAELEVDDHQFDQAIAVLHEQGML